MQDVIFRLWEWECHACDMVGHACDMVGRAYDMLGHAQDKPGTCL